MNVWRVLGLTPPSPQQAPVQRPFQAAPPFSTGADSVRFSARKPKVDPEQRPVGVKLQFPQGFWKRLQMAAKNLGISESEYIQHSLPHLTKDPPKKAIVDSVADVVEGMHNGKRVKTKVKTLLGPEQIFDEWISILNRTEKYAQISMYNFENEAVEGGRGIDGADISPGWKKQQQILNVIEKKARQGVRFQLILDNSIIRERDEFGNPIFPRKHTNAGMIDYLRNLQKEGLPIDVVAYPRSIAHIYHVKMLVADGKRALVGGMNLSNHSAANWDACVSLDGPEVANLQQQTFNADWLLAKRRQNRSLTLEQLQADLPKSEAVSHPGIKVLNTFPREYKEVGLEPAEGIGDYFKAKLNDPKLSAIHSEQFIASHKEIKARLIQLSKQGVPVKMLHSSSVVDQFPYTRKAVFEMMKAGVPVRFYNEWEEIGQKLHSKWTVFNNNEVIIGSANLSARGLETNKKPGLREDYPNHPGERYKRGNRDMAIVIPKSPKIAEAFIKQFQYDWDHSPPQHPAGYGWFEKAVNFKLFQDIAEKLKGALQS